MSSSKNSSSTIPYNGPLRSLRVLLGHPSSSEDPVPTYSPPLEDRKMSIVKSVLIYGYGEGTVGASLAMALAGKPVHVFACWPTLSEMSQFEDIPNITPLKLNPESPLGIQQAKEQLMTRLSTGGLNILINAGYIGHESIRGCTVERRAALWRSHISSLDQISLAFRPLLIASRGTIVNLVNHEIAIYDLMIRKSHCGYCISFNPLTNW